MNRQSTEPQVESFHKNTYSSVGDAVFRSLRTAILSAKYKPGDRIVETALASQMGVSKTPVREALRRLASEGLICLVPHKEAVVRGLSPKDIDQIQTIRASLEGLAAGLAAAEVARGGAERGRVLSLNLEEHHRLVDAGAPLEEIVANGIKFHNEILVLSANSWLWRLLQNFRDYLQQVRYMTYLVPGWIARSTEQHEVIAGCILSGDVEGAEKSMRAHIQDSREMLLRISAQ